MSLILIGWLALGAIMFDIVFPFVKKYVGRSDNVMSLEERDSLAQSLGYIDWEQYVHYEISLPVEYDAAHYNTMAA